MVNETPPPSPIDISLSLLNDRAEEARTHLGDLNMDKRRLDRQIAQMQRERETVDEKIARVQHEIKQLETARESLMPLRTQGSQIPSIQTWNEAVYKVIDQLKGVVVAANEGEEGS